MLTKSYHLALNTIYSMFPTVLKRTPYHLLYWFIKTSALLFRSKVSVRNTFLTIAFEPGKSDIDFTVIFLNDHILTQKIFIIWLKIIRRVFPFMGEVNYYDTYSLRFLDVHNVAELKQDPAISAIMGEMNKDSSIDSAIFILKKIFYNKLQLANDAVANRSEKWKHYFSLCGLNVTSVQTTNDIVLYSTEILNRTNTPGYSLLYNLMFQDKTQCVTMLYLNPAEWIQHCNINNYQFSYQELTIAAIKWEIAGIWTQYRTLDASSALVHLSHLKKIIKLVSQDANLLDNIKLLEQRINHFYSK